MCRKWDSLRKKITIKKVRIKRRMTLMKKEMLNFNLVPLGLQNFPGKFNQFQKITC